MHVYTEQKPLNDLVCHNVVLVGQVAHGMVVSRLACLLVSFNQFLQAWIAP